MSRFLSGRFADLTPYTPGEQPRDRSYVKLNTNESPFPPSPQVIAAVNASEVERLNLYPDPECRLLKKRLAESYGVGEENVFVANGSDDILNFFFMAFCDGGVAFPSLSYGFYPVYAKLHKLHYTAVPLREGFRLEAEDYCAIGSAVVLANPNAPTGRAVSVGEIERIVASNPDHAVLVDEAYIDFGGVSCRGLLPKYDNLIVCQTFSKSRSLAGGRLGFALGSEGLIRDLHTLKFSTNPYDINRLTQAAAIAALDSQSYYDKNCGIIAGNRAFTVMELEELGFEVVPSVANFIFVRHPDLPGGALYRRLKERGVLVRHWDSPEIADYCRVTIGSMEQMQLLIRRIRELLEEDRHAQR